VRERDVDRAVAAEMAANDGVTTRRQAAQLGVDRAMVLVRKRAGWFAEPAPGVLVAAAAPATWRQQVRVAALAGGGAVASHRTAARLHGLDGFAGELAVEVSVVATRRYRLAGVVSHHVETLDRRDLVVVDGIACTGLARTLSDLGSVCPPDQVRQALDDARRRRASLKWLNDTARRLHRPGQRGTGVLLALLQEAAVEGRAPDSWFERLVERCLACPDLPPLVRQHVVRDERGRFTARIDVALPSIKLGIEAHSRAFHTGPTRERADEDRDLRLAALGWEILYVGWQQTKDPAGLLEVVVAATAGRSLA
jgi:hypothetical protein